MRHFLSVKDVPDPVKLAEQALEIKKTPFAWADLGKNKTIGLLFFNSSLRTRMSTQKAARNLGMEVMVMNVGQDSWQIETADGVVMNADKAEHIREAAAVIGQYCDILGVRSFPSLVDREKDYSEHLIDCFRKYAGVPILSLESATVHPLQSLADMMTILEQGKPKPKIVLTWAPHVRALPQAVPNSFSEWMLHMDAEFVITHPKGMELSTQFTGGLAPVYDQDEALANADFVYVKNWSSFHDYGKIGVGEDWTFTEKKLKITNDARVMHCLPVRRNVVISDTVLDGPNSIVIDQANNRTYAAQAVILEMLKNLSK